MKAVWVDLGQDANPPLLRKYGVQDVYFDIRDPRIGARLDLARTSGFGTGVYACSQGEGWGPFVRGRDFAEFVFERFKEIGLAGPAPIKCCLNIEAHDPGFVLEALQTYRGHFPRRITSWAMEGHQGGWMAASVGFVAAVSALSVDLVAEAYSGAMVRTESDRVALELVLVGFSPTRVWCFYDGAQLGAWWEGFVFTQGGLPA